MTLVRSIVAQTVRQSDPGRDVCVSVVYHTVSNNIVWGGPDYQNHANEVRDLFAGLNTTSGSTFQFYVNRGLLVKVYNMADAKPRPIKATAGHTPTSWEVQNLAPREIAACLSFYGTNRGRPHERGRIYVGPFNAVDVAHETVQPTMRDQLVDLGHGLFDIGGENVAHVVHSPTTNTETVVQNYWCNDLWDHLSSREQKEGARTTLTP